MELFHFVIIFVLLSGKEAAREECIDDQNGCKHAIRKRRAVMEDSCSDGAKTPKQASDILKGYEGQIALNSYNKNTMTKKREFFTAAQSLLPAICKNMTTEAVPSQAVSKLAELHVQRKACNETESMLSDIPCERCSQQKVGKYRITKNVLENNGRWNCSQNSSRCDGVCIGSMRMAEDLMSNFSTGCRSHVINVQMFNPRTGQPVKMSSAEDVMSVEIQFEVDNSKQESSDYKCFVWQHGVGRWNGSLCNLQILPRNRSNSGPHVAQCNCTSLGSVCVAFNNTEMNDPSFGGSLPGEGAQTTSTPDGEILTTSAPSEGVQTTSPPGNTTGKVYASFIFDIECSTIKGTDKEQLFRNAATQSLREKFSLQNDQIVNLTVECGSLVLTFEIYKLDPSAVPAKIAHIGSVSISGNFTITLDRTAFKPSWSKVGYGPANYTPFYPITTTLPPTTAKRYELVFDYTPIMMAVAVGIAAMMFCVCCTCIVHSWYLRKNKFTEYNSMSIKEYERKMRAKEHKDRLKEVEDENEFAMTKIGAPKKVAPVTTNFDMTNETMPRLNETSLTNYDWAHTSFSPGMLAQLPSYNEETEPPKLILDEDSSESGEENEGFEQDSNLDIPKSVSHLSLDGIDGAFEANEDSQSTSASESPVIYDNITDSPEVNRNPIEEIYDNMNDNPNGLPPEIPPRPAAEPEYSIIE